MMDEFWYLGGLVIIIGGILIGQEIINKIKTIKWRTNKTARKIEISLINWAFLIFLVTGILTFVFVLAYGLGYATGMNTGMIMMLGGCA